MKNPMKHTNSFLQQRAFTYYIKDYDSKKKIYTLENPITKEERFMEKDVFDKMYGEQHSVRENDPVHDGEGARKILVHH